MGLPKISIELKNGGLGLVAPSEDAVVGLLLNGIAANNTPLLTPRQLFSLADFDAWMLTATATGVYVDEARRQITDFYKLAGSGSELWVMFIDATAVLATVLTSQAQTLLQAAEGRIRVLGVTRHLAAEPATPLLVGGLDADAMNALDEAHALAVAQATANMPLRIVLEAKYFDVTAAATLQSLKGFAFNRVSVLLGRTYATTKTTCMGLLLGRVAAVPVNRSVGRLKDGPVSTFDGYLGTTLAKTISDGTLGAIHDKGYIVLRKHVGKGGFFFSSDPTATADTDDYNRLHNGRVIDKVHRIAYATFLEEMLDEVLVDENTGKILPTTIKQYQVRIERAIDKAMTQFGEISGVQAFIDPNQDILGTKTLYVDLKVAPTGTNENINVSLGFYNPLAAV